MSATEIWLLAAAIVAGAAALLKFQPVAGPPWSRLGDILHAAALGLVALALLLALP